MACTGRLRRQNSFTQLTGNGTSASAVSADEVLSVNGGEMLGHWGRVKLYHPVGKASEKVRANWPA